MAFLRFRSAVPAALLAVGATMPAAAAPPPPSATNLATPVRSTGDVYSVMAAYLVNFAKQLSWPATVLPEGEPLRIGVLGDDPFGAKLDAMLAGRSAGDHAFVAVRGQTAAELEGCHLVFVSNPRAAAKELGKLAGRPLATVTYQPAGFAETGCTIELVLVQDFPRFVLNVGALKQQGLTYSRPLWDLALDRRPGPVIMPAAQGAMP